MTKDMPCTARVLLIEDQEHEAILVNRLLRHCNPPFSLVHASTLAAAIEMLKAGDFQVCLLDLGLPDANGIDSFHRVASVDARLPIVVLTGNDDEHLGLSAIKMGAQDYVAKNSISGQLLSRALRFAIARQQKMLGHAADANTDVLTGMPNRRRLDTCFTELSASSEVLSMGLLDIDYFKSINDTHGHLVGDQVLKHLAITIRDALGDGIPTARFGGEEFAVLLPEKSAPEAVEVIDQLLLQIERSPVAIADTRLSVTASAGVSELLADESFECLLQRTDEALYDAKRSGRNRVCVRT